MMRKPFSVLALFLPISTFAAGACQHEYGSIICGSTVESSLLANGTATLNGTTVTADVEVNGTLKANNVKLNTLFVNGTAVIHGGKISGEVEINGTLDATQTQFSSIIYLASNHSKLKDCTTHEIAVEDSPRVEQKIYLISSQVNGDITFKGKNGQVYLCKGSTVTGKINGGVKIEQC